jgi:SEC-C motif
MGGDGAYEQTALSNRGQFTEDLAFGRLCKVFGAHVHANVHLKKSKGEEVGEIDVLVVFGDRAIVLQAKSKRLTLEARKGNDLRVKDDFEKAIQASYDQALTCSKALIVGKRKLIDKNGNEIKVSTLPKQVFPICIVADHYPALAFQARQFLKFEATDEIRPPLIIDVFALDAMTEMLETPLRLLSYLDLRSTFGQKILFTHELTLLSAHLKYNLWINEKYDLVSFEDDIAIHIDAAMAVRREGLSGARTPDGVLARIKGTHIGQILSEIEARPDPSTIALGLLLLSLNEDSLDTINKGIRTISVRAARDGRNHDFTLAFGHSSSGITIHCNSLPPNDAADQLFRHCSLRKYSEKAARWFGLGIAPGRGAVRFGLTLEGTWIENPDMDAAVQRMPPGIPPDRIASVLNDKTKIGRNDPCPCGSGRKYKKCCFPR